jgi:LPS-assembly protein
MKKQRFSLSLCILAVLAMGAILMAEPQPEYQLTVEPLTARSQVFYYFDQRLSVGTNGVVVRYQDVVLTADTILLNEETGDARAEGDVSLQRGISLWRGDQLNYNFITREIQAGHFRVGIPPFFAAGQALQTTVDGGYHAEYAILTTDDVARPGFRIRARELKIIPGQRIEARGATFEIRGVPVMYLPFYTRSLERHPNNWVLTPGYRRLYGPYLLSTYNWYLNDHLEGAVHLDWRQRRGFGFGPDFHYDAGRAGSGSLITYYTRDKRPGEDPLGLAIDEDRYRIGFSHFTEITTDLTAKAIVRHQSDPFIIRDFFEPEYRSDPQPKSFLEVSQLWPDFTLNVLVLPQINDFFQTVERLPDVKLSAMRQQLGVSPFFYESETSLGYFRFRAADRQGTNYAAFRGDTFHQLLLPKTFFGWLNVTPRAGGRLTYYGDTHGEGVDLDDRARGVFNTGAEASAKASRVWRQARLPLLEVNELRHIIQPSLNYVFVPSPTRRPHELPQFDMEIPSLRLLPIHFPDYNAIDAIDSQNVLRMALRNKVQTKRADLIDNLVNWALYTDWRLDPRPGQGTFADLFSDMDLRPRSWLTINSELRYDIQHTELRAANHRAIITPSPVWSLSLGHRFFREHPLFGPESGHNLIHSSLYYRLNENWGFRTTHYYEARDGRMEEQYYTVYRDLRSWTSALTFRVRENRRGPTDYTVAITFSLKAFPRFGLGGDRHYHSVLLGG